VLSFNTLLSLKHVNSSFHLKSAKIEGRKALDCFGLLARFSIALLGKKTLKSNSRCFHQVETYEKEKKNIKTYMQNIPRHTYGKKKYNP